MRNTGGFSKQAVFDGAAGKFSICPYFLEAGNWGELILVKELRGTTDSILICWLLYEAGKEFVPFVEQFPRIDLQPELLCSHCKDHENI